MSARRSLLTATAAGTLLGALWFVPSANATGDEPTADGARTSASTVLRTKAETVAETSSETASTSTTRTTQLADTGSFDTTPYVVGGTLFLSLGAGFVVYSVRRERMAAY
ncbi:LPXTG cell wall anchor domain-containing protein [Streptomyces sp. NPDC050704]|uniref:LPXTG cell wall anchor domain-containing protein n=1 Tax=Streptomyces sp. NPDC050704 TaxID=3157219 RepID=UPI0034304CD5